ncbi:MAG: hypothetical protein ACK5N8_05260 [Alphaproteobacteria bacterium]
MVDLKEENNLETENDEEYEYEYEYVEVPEGEELPESDGEYEYEYEYVEVPEGEEPTEEKINLADEDFPLEEISAPEENVPQEKKVEEVEIDLDDLLGGSEEIEEIHPDDIANLEETSAAIEEIDVDELLSQDDEFTSVDLVDDKASSNDENLNFEYVEFPAEEKIEEKETSIETLKIDDIEIEEIKDDTSEGDEVVSESDMEIETTEEIDIDELLGDKAFSIFEEETVEELENESPSEENIAQVEDVPLPETDAEVIDVDYVDAEPEPVEETIIEEPAPDEIETIIEDFYETPAEPVLESSDEVVSEALSAPEEENYVVLEDVIPEVIATAVPVAELFMEDEKKEEPKAEDEEIRDVIVSSKVDANKIVITDDIKFETQSLSIQSYEKEIEAAKVVSNSDGISVFYAIRNKDTIAIADSINELSQWTLVVLDRKMTSLSERDENVFPLVKNSIRIAKLLKNGQERIGFFDEEEYNILPKTDDFGMLKGKFIAGPVDDDTGLIINDFINVALVGFYGQKLIFEKPVSGMLVGPKGSILYFSNLKNIVLPLHKSENVLAQKEKIINEVKVEIDNFYELSSQDNEKTFIGDDEKNSIQINSGITTYGWNITFDNDVTMSIRDLMTYQSRNGRMPSESGKIVYGRKIFEFRNIKSVVLYETPQYFSYGR